MSAPIRSISTPAAAVALLAGSTFADVHNLTAGTSNAELQTAINAAVDDDILLVDGGSYNAFTIDNKSLSIFSQEGATVTIIGKSRIRNLDPDRAVSIVGLYLQGNYGDYGDADPALEVTDTFGAVRLQACELRGTHGFDYSVNEGDDGGSALILDHAFDVALVDVQAFGGNGGEGDPFYGPGGRGGRGVEAETSAVAIYDSIFRGGNGADGGASGGRGGDGYWASGLGLFAMGSQFHGGHGADALDSFCTGAGRGGDGLRVLGLGTAARLIDNSYSGGQGGDGNCCCSDGSNGQGKWWSGGFLSEVPGVARPLSAPRVVSDGGAFMIDVVGLPGDQVWLPMAPITDFTFTTRGVWLLPYPPMMMLQALGLIGIGNTAFPVHVGSMAPSRPAKVIHCQGFFVTVGGEWALGTGLQVLVINE